MKLRDIHRKTRAFRGAKTVVLSPTSGETNRSVCTPKRMIYHTAVRAVCAKPILRVARHDRRTGTRRTQQTTADRAVSGRSTSAGALPRSRAGRAAVTRSQAHPSTANIGRRVPEARRRAKNPDGVSARVPPRRERLMRYPVWAGAATSIRHPVVRPECLKRANALANCPDCLVDIQRTRQPRRFTATGAEIYSSAALCARMRS